MKRLYMKQKMMSINEKFTVTDHNGETLYRVQGSLFKLSKSFTMTDSHQQPIGTVTKELFKMIPKFTVDVNGKESVTIEKKLTFFKSKYHIQSDNITINGDILDKQFEIIKGNTKIGMVTQKWLAMTSTYEITIYDEDYEHLIVLFVAAVDFLKAQHHAASNSANT